MSTEILKTKAKETNSSPEDLKHSKVYKTMVENEN